MNKPKASPEELRQTGLLLDALGGNKVVAAKLAAKARQAGWREDPLCPNAIALWRRRGIAGVWRFVVASLCKGSSVEVPAWLLMPPPNYTVKAQRRANEPKAEKTSVKKAIQAKDILPKKAPKQASKTSPKKQPPAPPPRRTTFSGRFPL